MGFLRVPVLNGITYECQSGCCKLYVTTNYDDTGVKEVFVSTDGTGCSASLNGLGRAISVGLQDNIDQSELLKSLSKVKCPACINNKKSEGLSCPDIISKLVAETQKRITHG